VTAGRIAFPHWQRSTIGRASESVPKPFSFMFAAEFAVRERHTLRVSCSHRAH
jgi:hypothetical protein